jgi:deazaflavin-dependent oxidoreductase (nitroreductase family)
MEASGTWEAEQPMANDEFTRALNASREVELTVTGRKSGRAISMPVWFARDGGTLYLVPVQGADSDWYRNVLRTPAIRLATGGAELAASAAPVTDPARVGEIVDLFRAKYGARDVAAYYPKQNAAVQVPLG